MPALTAVLPPALVERVRDFRTWWAGELGAMVPESLRRLRKPPPRSEVHSGGEGILLDREVQGVGERFAEPRRLEQLDEPAWAELGALIHGTRARLILSPPDVFVTRLTLPLAARARLRTAVALQLRQVAPVEPEHLVWNCRAIEEDRKSVIVLVAMARATTVERLAGLFEANGLAPPPMVARSGERELELIDGEDGSLTPERRKWRRASAIAALMLATVPLTSWGAASLLTWNEERRAEAMHRELGPRLAEERARALEDRARYALKAVLELPAASSQIEALALGLPDSAFALGAERKFDGRFMFETRSTDRAALERSVADSPMLSQLHPSSIGPVDGPNVQLTLAGDPR
jgi:hypothetical protein